MTAPTDAAPWSVLENLPRRRLAAFPTPLLPLPTLGRELGLELWCKRDDLIGFGLGGNKVRGLEFLMAEALAQGAEVIVTGAGPQSNHVRATAAAAAHASLACLAVFWGEPPERVDGNYRLTRMLGAEPVFTGDPDRASVDAGIASVCERLREQGRQSYAIPRGGACPLGALGHARAARELAGQCQALGLKPDAIVLATGSGGTQAGWLLGSRLLGTDWRVEGYTVSRAATAAREQVAHLASAAARLLSSDGAWTPAAAVVHDGYIGAGYGVPTPAAAEAIRRVARREGVLLDPVYTGKAMAGFLDRRRRGLAPYRSVVFLHTGGEPAFFAGDGQWLA